MCPSHIAIVFDVEHRPGAELCCSVLDLMITNILQKSEFTATVTLANKKPCSYVTILQNDVVMVAKI